MQFASFANLSHTSVLVGVRGVKTRTINLYRYSERELDETFSNISRLLYRHTNCYQRMFPWRRWSDAAQSGRFVTLGCSDARLLVTIKLPDEQGLHFGP
jgi:hypothetical protein